MNPLELLFKRIFGIDPTLQEAQERTEKIEGHINGDVSWMMSCRPVVEKEKRIECDDGQTYKRES